MGLRRIIKAIGLVALAIMAKLSGASAADNSTNFTDITGGGLGDNSTGGDGGAEQHWDGVGKSLAIAGAVGGVAICAICGITCVCDRCISRRSAAVAPSEGDGAGSEGSNEQEGGPPVIARPRSASTPTSGSLSSASLTGQHQ